MTGGDALLDEVEWMLGAGVHPLLIAQELHRKHASILRLAQKHHRVSVVEALKLDPIEERTYLRRVA